MSALIDLQNKQYPLTNQNQELRYESIFKSVSLKHEKHIFVAFRHLWI